jgi:hypothetical protein
VPSFSFEKGATLILKNNYLTGDLPNSWSNAVVGDFIVNNNYFSGTVPDLLVQRTLDVSSNLFSRLGEISGQVESIKARSNQLVSWANLEKPISLSSLTSLDLSFNKFKFLNALFSSQTNLFTKLNFLDVSNNILECMLSIERNRI